MNAVELAPEAGYYRYVIAQRQAYADPNTGIRLLRKAYVYRSK